VTVSLQVGVETLTWSQFAWENGYEPATRIDGAPKTFVFDRQQHAAMLGDAYDRTAGLPYELAHHGRSFLGPGNGAGACRRADPLVRRALRGRTN